MRNLYLMIYGYTELPTNMKSDLEPIRLLLLSVFQEVLDLGPAQLELTLEPSQRKERGDNEFFFSATGSVVINPSLLNSGTSAALSTAAQLTGFYSLELLNIFSSGDDRDIPIAFPAPGVVVVNGGLEYPMLCLNQDTLVEACERSLGASVVVMEGYWWNHRSKEDGSMHMCRILVTPGPGERMPGLSLQQLLKAANIDVVWAKQHQSLILIEQQEAAVRAISGHILEDWLASTPPELRANWETTH